MVNIYNYLHPSIVQVENQLIIAYHLYYKLKKDALKLREYWLRDIVALKEKENGVNQEVIYKKIMNWEKQLRVGRRLQRATVKSQTGLTHVEVNTTTGKEEMTEKEYVEYSCNDDNRGKYS